MLMKPVHMILGKVLIKMMESSDSKFVRRTGIIIGLVSNLFTWPLQIGDFIIDRIIRRQKEPDDITFEEGINCIKEIWNE